MKSRLLFILAAVVMLFAGCRDNVGLERVSWPTMGTVAAIQTKGDRDGVKGGKLLAKTMSIFKDVETLLNAHKPDSEISQLASLSDRQVLQQCAKSTKPCYEAAFALAKATEGAFNPRWRGEGTLDLGAIAKGFAVDLACDDLAGEATDIQCLVDLGGNVKAVRGSWKTGVKNPGGEGFAAVVELNEGEALATSATYFRGSHIYDGRTNKPVENDVASVTVLCRSAMWADGLSTSLFVLGVDDGRKFLDARVNLPSAVGEVSAMWILKDGRKVVHPAAASNRFQPF